MSQTLQSVRGMNDILPDEAESWELFEDTIRSWVKKDTIPFHKVGRLYKFRVSEVDAWIESGASADADKNNSEVKDNG